MGMALQAYRWYRELADRGEFRRVSEVLDENWIENCLGLTGRTPGLDTALANLVEYLGGRWGAAHRGSSVPPSFAGDGR